MHKAHNAVADPLGAAALAAYAAEIRAVRDWLLPEEIVGEIPPANSGVTGGVEWCVARERQRLRTLLTAEAGRALEHQT